MPTRQTPATTAPARTHQQAVELFRRPFAPGAIGFRAMTKVAYHGDPWGGAQVAAYLNAQSVIQRLNCVVPGRWRQEFGPLEGDLLAASADGDRRSRLYLACRLIVTLPIKPGGPDADAVYEDVGELDAGSLAGLKALYSDARKRAGVAAGIGAYLYTALAAVVLPIGPQTRQVRVTRRSGKSDLLSVSSETEQWLRDGYGCCAGPLQFNLRDGPPSTWDRYRVDGNRDGRRDVYDPADAIPSAANYLRALLRNADGNLSQAVFGYNHSQAYVKDVLARARDYTGLTDLGLAGPVGDPTVMAGCAGGGIDVPLGPANLRVAERVVSPRAYRTLPSWALAGSTPGAIDARLYDDVVWILRRYHLRVMAAREAGHRTHGDGTAIDLIPADGTTQPVWDASASRLAHDLGWTPACGQSGTRPTCRLAPAIQFIGYDGYPGHGSPRTCTGDCPAHLHVSWASPCYGTSSLSSPCEWVMAFPTSPSI